MGADRIVRRAVLVVSLGLAATLLPIAAGAASAPAAPAERGGVVSPRLEQLAAAPPTTTEAAENRAAGAATSGPGSLLHQPDGTFLVNARLTTVDAATLGALKATGARITARGDADHLVTLAIDASQIDAVGDVTGVEWLQEILAPTIGRTDREGLAGAIAEGVPTTNALCSSKITSEGDSHLGAATARATYGVDGTGVKIGVLSDSYNRLGGADTDIANGELPGPGNPCGSTTPVTVQAEMAGTGPSDEGRGMAQAVHDLAPGAQILFATAYGGDVDFANQIRNLAAAGAKVIVDDIGYSNEPTYQDGVIAKAILDVTAAGVTYFSSAGNGTLAVGGKSIGSYEAGGYRPTTCPGTITAVYENPDCHDWDPGAGTSSGNLLTVANGGLLQLTLGWNEPSYGVTTDLDLFLLDGTTNATVAQSTAGNANGSKTANEFIQYQNTSGAAKTYRLVVGRYQGAAPRFKTQFFGASGLTATQWNTSSGTDVYGPTGNGHNMMRNAGSIAAIRYNSTTSPESFSSRGPATYCWNPVNGTTAATALASCVTDTIDVTATDGAANSFFGSLDGSVYRFYGTSQAAPHAAAVAVLQVAARPCRTPAEILAAQRASGIAIGAFGVDAVGGGRLDASAAISGLAACATAPGAPTGVTGTAGNAQVSLSWTAPASNGGSAITGYTVTPSIGATAQAPVVFTSTATSQTIGGLTNGTAYTFRVKATNAAGTGADSTASAAITPIAPPTAPGAPTGVTGTAGNAQVSLSWTAPASNGGSAITGYTVTPYTGATAQAPVVFTSTATTQTIGGLTNGTAYTFRVKATNAAGTGADSAASAAITPRTVPGAPTGVTGTAGNTEVALTWTAPASNGGSAITGYTVTPYLGAAAQTPVVFGSTATNQTVTGLTNGSAYTFTVKAVNAAGSSAESAASSAVTPTEPVPPTDPWEPFASWSALVDRLYQDLLGRAPTSSERTTRIAQLTGGTLTPGGLVAAVRLDPDHVNNVDSVTRLYRAYFLRIPDTGGLTYWIRQRRVNGKKLNAISDSFATSSEFRSKYGALSNRAFVELIYQNVLGRPGEASGVNYWTSRLDRKVNTRGQVMTGFSESNEYRTKQVSEVHVSVIFILLLGRAPTSAEFTDLVAALDASTTTPAAIAEAIIDSPAYATRIGG